MTSARWAVRDLQAADRPGWDRLWAAYLDFYGEDLPGEVTDHVFGRLADVHDPDMFGLVALAPDGSLVGLANVVVHANTWSARLDAYLEDLVTDPAHRGRGIGHALIATLVDRAQRQGWRRVHWHTEADNGRARRLYDDVAEISEYVRYIRPVT